MDDETLTQVWQGCREDTRVRVRINMRENEVIVF